jgi:glycosyltransferase involved in cell wall biosynthesis
LGRDGAEFTHFSQLLAQPTVLAVGPLTAFNSPPNFGWNLGPFVIVAHTQSRRESPDSPKGQAQSLRILFVHQRLGAFGGAEANIRITARELRRRGHALSLLWAEGTGKDEPGSRDLFSQCHQLPKEAAQLKLLLKRLDPDLVYLHSLSDLTAMEAIFDSRRPVIRMVHDHSLYCLRSYKYNPLTRKPCTRAASGHCVFPCLAPLARNRTGLLPFKWADFGRLRRELELTRQCEALIAYSQYSKAELVANGFDPERIHIHVPMDCRGEAHPVSSFSNRNLVLFAGQIIRGKGVDLLLRALAKVRSQFECTIAGEGNHRSYCERLCRKLGLQDKVRFAGYLPPSELEKLYLDASLFTFSSVWPEPFGMAGPEAMRFGLPVVAFDAGAVREWLIDGENGLLASWGNIDEFADGIDALLGNKERARALGLNGRALVNREYKDVHQIDSLEKLFLELSGRTAVTRASAKEAFNLDGSRPTGESVLLEPIQAAKVALHV